MTRKGDCIEGTHPTVEETAILLGKLRIGVAVDNVSAYLLIAGTNALQATYAIISHSSAYWRTSEDG
jgi:hypothetical protein